jgi:choline dehydrogenase-like flavoprotein
METNQTYDTIVIGAGSAGCVITRRLVDAGQKVLLLEAGPADNSQFIHMPATFVRVIGTERTWVYESTEQKHANGRKMYVPQGKTLGGGSSVNAMVYIRGQHQDYDDWAAQGCSGWDWASVLPWFKKAEANQILSGALHGTDGPLSVSETRHRHPLSEAFIKAAQETGLAHNADFNGQHQAGVGFYQSTTRNGERASTAVTYLDPVRGKPGLTIETGALVQKITLQGKRATGVVWRNASGNLVQATAKNEVVLAAGALASPKLLMLSGIGPGKQLQAFGIPVVKDLDGVGRNFQDHLEVSVYGRCKEPISLAGNDTGLRALRHGLQWKLTRTGLLTSNVVESGGFADTTGAGRPDIQFHVLPVLVGDVDREPLSGHGISINPCFLRPKSRGVLELASADASVAARFDGGFLSEQDDVDTLVRGVQLARKIIRAPSLSKLISEELAPSAKVDMTRDELEAYVRSRAKTVYHPAGTCRMGAANDAATVVTPDLKVQGIERLRVCDASVIPNLVSGNTNAPVVMIAERCAHFMLGH